MTWILSVWKNSCPEGPPIDVPMIEPTEKGPGTFQASYPEHHLNHPPPCFRVQKPIIVPGCTFKMFVDFNHFLLASSCSVVNARIQTTLDTYSKPRWL